MGWRRWRGVPRAARQPPAMAVRPRYGGRQATVAHHAGCGWTAGGGLVRLCVGGHGVLLPGRARSPLGARERRAGPDGTDDPARDRARLCAVQLPARGRLLQTAVDLLSSPG